jgi:hypothetical protein
MTALKKAVETKRVPYAENASNRIALYDNVITKYTTSEVMCQLAYEKLACIAKLWGTIK